MEQLVYDLTVQNKKLESHVVHEKNKLMQDLNARLDNLEQQYSPAPPDPEQPTPRRSPRNSPRKNQQPTPRRSPRKSPRKNKKSTPRRSPRNSPHKNKKSTPRLSPRLHDTPRKRKSPDFSDTLRKRKSPDSSDVSEEELQRTLLSTPHKRQSKPQQLRDVRKVLGEMIYLNMDHKIRSGFYHNSKRFFQVVKFEDDTRAMIVYVHQDEEINTTGLTQLDIFKLTVDVAKKRERYTSRSDKIKNNTKKSQRATTKLRSTPARYITLTL